MELSEREEGIFKEISECKRSPGVYTLEAIGIVMVKHIALIEDRLDKLSVALKIDK